MMSLDKLIKKIEVFEKTALYTDSGNFLKKISQRGPDPEESLKSYSKIENFAHSVYNAVKEFEHKNYAVLGKYSTELTHLIASSLDLTTAEKVLDCITRLESEVRLIPELSDLRAKVIPYLNGIRKELETIKESIVEYPPPAIREPVSFIRHPRELPKEVQEQLNILGSPVKLTVDGVLGPQTQKALDWFKNTYNVPMSVDDEELYKVIKNEFSKMIKKEVGGLSAGVRKVPGPAV